MKQFLLTGKYLDAVWAYVPIAGDCNLMDDRPIEIWEQLLVEVEMLIYSPE